MKCTSESRAEGTREGKAEGTEEGRAEGTRAGSRAEGKTKYMYENSIMKPITLFANFKLISKERGI